MERCRPQYIESSKRLSFKYPTTETPNLGTDKYANRMHKANAPQARTKHHEVKSVQKEYSGRDVLSSRHQKRCRFSLPGSRSRDPSESGSYEGRQSSKSKIELVGHGQRHRDQKAHEPMTFLKQAPRIQDVKCTLSVMTRVQALAHMTGHVIGHAKITNIGLIGVNTNICQKVECQVTPQSLGLGHLGDIGNTTPKVVRNQSTTQENLNLDFTLVTHQANLTKCPIMDIMLVIMAIISGCLKICALMGRKSG
ncbi:hypothetical protein DPMN_010412 [Dreissena polymorpha]|uniref:Uncharacterized protein n=1 Tax=Dreissena polymorpha TaxID=45954 RepID=A0A9D4N292_DREPO|nr:hypothetical protein DPMN_010412 [Dreissena polymorpha]